MFRVLMRLPLLRPILRPLTRFIVGLIAIPLFRLFLKKVIRLQDLDAELEKDLEQWFRASLVLLIATRNMEESLFPFLQGFQQGDEIGMGLRIMLAIGVVEMMPDQELFAVIHPGPPKLTWNRQVFGEMWEKKWAIGKGVLCQHLNRSSPVFAILAAIATGWIGWVCYGLALIQYLIIGLVTSRDKALDVLSEFDRAVALRRRQLLEEFDIDEGQSTGQSKPTPPAKTDDDSSPGQTDTETGDTGPQSV
jgi:hypothetical protein